ncbi:unnamed protein product [Sphenostylis stenocarpa]|uniref:Epidermal patterning factor-like protein n=1 Tax=Sphenostylis stenocarpa TaxID=92480 RepID=A0AA86RVU5_9FABA|nr:unnamed protein product [Sphenostylis stenocarpa]
MTCWAFMIMSSLNPIRNSTITILLVTTIIVTFLLHHLLCPVSCFIPPQHAIHPSDPLYEKNRLGSVPPTCHNKCNQCHPCMAVQVPSLGSHDRVHPASLSPSAAMQGFFLQGNSIDWSLKSCSEFVKTCNVIL